MKLIHALAAIAVLALAAGPAEAADKVAKALLKKEAAATKKCAAELVKSAKTLTTAKAYDEAREQLELALRLLPGNSKARKAYRKLDGEDAETPEAATEKVAATVEKAHANCIKTLLPVLQAWEKAERPEDLGRLATTAVVCFGDDAFESLDLQWYEPYLLWARKSDVERWEKGDEFLDGAWVAAEQVKELDAAHTDWESPWMLGDGIQEVRTVMPLRAAKRVLHYVRSFRGLVIRYFDGEWEWHAPKGVLPIYLTETQADYTARLTDYDPAAAKSKASALYVQKTGGLCPVFLTFEPKSVAKGTNIGWESLLRDVRHEVAHQLLYELCMAQGAAVGGNIDWVSEGIATFLGSYRPRKGAWRLARVSQEPYANGTEPGPFAWVKGNFDAVQPLSQYLAEFKPNLTEVQEYWVATTLTWFLLEGERRLYRDSMIKLLIDVHMAKGDKDSFAECFGKVDLDAMQKQWHDFVRRISIQVR